MGVDTHVIFDDRISRFNQPSIIKQVDRGDAQQQTEHITLHPVKSGWPFNLDLYSGYAFGFNPSASKLLKEIVSKVEPDVYHFHNYCLLGDHLLDIASKTGKPVFVSVHDFWPICPAMAYLDYSGNLCPDSIYQSQLRCFLCCLRQRKLIMSRLVKGRDFYTRRITKFIVSNEYLKELLIVKGFPPSMIEKVPYPVDTTIFSESPAEQSVSKFKQIHGLGGKNVILYTGKLHKMKGVHVLIDAFKDAHAQNTNLALVIVGDGVDLQRLEERAAGEEDIHFLGKLSQHELLCAYEACDIFAMPSLYPEFFSISSHEAMLRKKPVIATNYAALPEFIVDGENGLLFERGDVAGLAGAIKKLVADKGLRAKLGQRGYEMARKFILEKHISNLLQIYEDVSRGPARLIKRSENKG